MNTIKLKPVAVILTASLLATAGAAPKRVVVSDVKSAHTLVRKFAVTLSSRSTIAMNFPMTGKLGKRNVSTDQEVRKGDVLAELEQDEFVQRVEKARIAAERAEATFRRMSAVTKGISEESRSQAEADMKAAAAELRIAEKTLADTKLFAPFDGVVVKTDGDVGQVIPGGTTVTRIHSKEVNVKLNVPERLIARDGWKERLSSPDIKVEVAACPGMLLPARFNDIDLISSTGTQTFEASYKIDTPPGYSFYEGMSATLYMPSFDPELKDMVDVPFDAVCRDADGSAYVWEAVREADGACRAHRRPVEIRHRNFSTVSVTGGPAEGGKVVMLGVSQIGEGMEIDPVKAKE